MSPSIYLSTQSIQPNTWFGFLLKVNCKAKMKVELSKDCLPSQIRLWLAFSIENYYLGCRLPHGLGKHGEVITSQPLAWVLKNEFKVNYVFSLRKLFGTSYHLIRSNNISLLTTECLFNYEFLLHKAWASSVISIEEDLKAATSAGSCEALKLSKKVLLKDPCQLASQLIGRLHQIVAADKPVAPGHMDKVTAVAEIQKDLTIVRTSQDGTLKFWDLSAGKATFTLHGVGKNIDLIVVCLENRLVAVTENKSFTVWDLSLEKVIYTAGGFSGHANTDIYNQWTIPFNGSQLVKVFDLTDSCQRLHQVHISSEDIPLHKDHSILVSNNSVKDYVLFAYRNGKEAMVFSARKGEVVAKLTSQEPVAAIQGVAVTKEYFLVIFRCPFMRQRDILHIKLFSVCTFTYTHTLKVCWNDFISTFFIHHLASHLVAFSPIPSTNTTEIILWNLESEDHKHLAKLSSVPVGDSANL
ncbi:unnamed protein product [Natator depressus]